MIISLLIVWEVMALLASIIMLVFCQANDWEDVGFSFGVAHIGMWGMLGIIALCSWILSLNL